MLNTDYALTGSQDLPYRPIFNEAIHMTAVGRDGAHDLVLEENVRFTKYFSTIGSKLAVGIKDGDIDPLSFMTVTHDDIFNFNFITIDEVIDALNLIQSKKSSGLDGISARLLKDGIHNIAGPLVDIFNL